MKPFFSLGCLYFIWVLILAPFAGAQGFDMLSIRMGGASVALGGAGVARSATIEGLFQNPAALADLKNVRVFGSVNPYLGMTLWSGAGTIQLGEAVTLGASGYGLLYGEFKEAVKLDGGLGIEASDYVLGLSSGFSFGKILKLPFDLSLGVTGRVSREHLAESSLTALMADIGTLASTPVFFKIHTLSFGAAVRHLGAGFFGTSPTLTLPTAAIFGSVYKIQSPVFSFSALADVEVAFSGKTQVSAGLELGFFKAFTLRSGYVFGDASRGFSLGGGGQLFFKNFDVSMDYSLAPFGSLGWQHNVQMTFAIGKLAFTQPVPETLPKSRSPKRLTETPAPRPVIGVLAGEVFFTGIKNRIGPVIEKKFPGSIFSQENVILAESEAAWLGTDTKRFAQLAGKLGLAKILVVLRAYEDGDRNAVVFVFDAASESFERREIFTLSGQEEESVILAMEKISAWQ